MKKLRRKIVLGVFLSATAVFALTVLIVGLALNIQVARRADTVTELIISSNGKLPEMIDFQVGDNRQPLEEYNFGEETLYRVRYFCVRYDSNGSVQSDLTHIAAVDSEEAVSLADSAKSRAKTKGYLDDYRYRISDDETLVVFLDNSDEVKTSEQQILLLILVALSFDLMITLVFWFLSKRIVKPFEENAQMQKQFITDASHELKTPLAIISANAEVLAYKDGDNEWIGNITSQVTRVSELVNELLTLNRLEEVEEITDVEPVDLSEKLTAAAATFEPVFSGKNAALHQDIDENVIVNGNPEQLERLISVLVENASKYVSENGEVKISLCKEVRFTHLSVYNTCEIDKTADYTHLFDRFYRPDLSRTSQTGGHGIGLSIAKRIVTLHNGVIEAVPSQGGLTFEVKLSNKLKPAKKRI